MGLQGLPGEDLVREGLRDLSDGIESPAALLVSIGAPPARGDAADGATRIYFTGGATAVLYGWRASTIDVDLNIVPHSDRLYRTLPDLKERLATNRRLMTSLRCPCRASHVKGDSA